MFINELGSIEVIMSDFDIKSESEMWIKMRVALIYKVFYLFQKYIDLRLEIIVTVTQIKWY